MSHTREGPPRGGGPVEMSFPGGNGIQASPRQCPDQAGDFDPSGMHMSEIDLPGRVEKYGGAVTITRIALTRADCDGLPSFDVETKIGDPRHAWFKKNHGDPLLGA